jgi:hypothetical protein
MSMSAKDVQAEIERLLAGRKTRCTYCKIEVPSSEKLAFFEFRGEGSRAATDSCAHCGYAEVAHTYGGNFAPPSERKNPHLCLNFDPPRQFEPHGPWDVDLFYCGCRGWD